LQTIYLESAIGIYEYQDRGSGNLNPSIPRNGNSRMELSDYCERVTIDPVANEFRSSFPAAVIDNNDFKTWGIFLFCQGSQTSIEWNPIIENSYDDAERQTCSCFLLIHRCIMLPRSGLTACRIAQATANHNLTTGV